MPRRLLVPGLLVGLCCLVGFVALTALVAGRVGSLVSFDHGWHDALMSFGRTHNAWVDAMAVVTHLGDTATLVIIDAVLVGFCLVRGWRSRAGMAAAVAVGGWALRIGMRDLVARPRPADAFWPEAMASYPSGHTTNATITVGLALFVLWPLLGRAGRIVAVSTAVLYAALVGLSRAAGGVHWPTDVAAGWLLGIGLVATVTAVRRPAGRHDRGSVHTGPQPTI